MSSNEFVHPISGLRLLRAQLPAPARARVAAALMGPVRIRAEPQRDPEENQENAAVIAYHQRRMAEEITAVREKFAMRRLAARDAFLRENYALTDGYTSRVEENVFQGSPEKLKALADKFTQKQAAAAAKYCTQKSRFSLQNEAAKIAAITERRTQLMWTCPNDGMAHPFTWEGRQYHRTYAGEVWLTENMAWRGYWTGNYIASGSPPSDLSI